MSIRIINTFASLAFSAMVLATPATRSWAQTPESKPAEPEVLMFEEAAAFLRLTTDELQSLIQQEKISGREINGRWLTTRTGLMTWLNGPVTLVTGGSKAAAAPIPAKAQSASVAAEHVADEQRALDRLLRDRAVLNEPGQTSIEVGVVRGVAENYVMDPTGTSMATLRNKEWSQTTTLRYGLDKQSQIALTMPFSSDVTTADGTRIASTGWFADNPMVRYSRLLRTSSRDSAAGVMGSVIAELPAGGSRDHYGLGGGLTLATSMDPAVLTIDLSYLRRLNVGNTGIPVDSIDVGLGVALGLNDQLSLGSKLSATYLNTQGSWDEQYRLSFLGGIRLSKGLYLEPNASFSLSGKPNSRLGATLSYSFGP